MTKLIIKNGTIVDPVRSLEEPSDILIDKGRIVQTGNINISDPKVEVIDAAGKIVTPGLFDMHTHVRDPGYEYKEDIFSVSRAAVKGGFTSITAMPNTLPPNDSASVTQYIIKKAKRCGLVNMYPIGAATIGLEGKMLSEVADLYDAGVVALSDDGRPIQSSSVMRRVMEYSKMFSLPVISHCEDRTLSPEGVMNEGLVSTELGLAGLPNAAEDIMVARDVALLRLTGSALHIAHISTAESVKIVRNAKKEGLNITCEVTPHHFTLTDEAVRGYNTNTKVNPPLRAKEDIAEIKVGLADGTIDAIATDHAPHEDSEKDVEYTVAPFGISGLETALPLALTLYFDGTISLMDVIAKLTNMPAKIMNIKKGSLSAGSDADITIIDLNRYVDIDTRQFESKGKNSPFNKLRLRGKAVMTIKEGRIVYNDEAQQEKKNSLSCTV